MDIKEAAKRVLEGAGIPLSVQEITNRMLAGGLWKTGGKTPEASVGATLYADIKKQGSNSDFVIAGKATFGLRQFRLGADSNAPPSQGESKAIAKGSQQNREEALTFLDAAEKVLDESGKTEPMHYADITRSAMEQGWLITSGRTPEATMGSRLGVEARQVDSRGSPKRFVRTSPGCYGLAKWTETGVANEIRKHNEKVRKKLQSTLEGMDPIGFESLVRFLLAEMGFEDTEVTEPSNDGGIDVRGTMIIDGVIRLKMAVQVKRLKASIGPNVVREVRGSLSSHEQGMIITTGDFTSSALKEAMGEGRSHVALVNGEQLTKLMMKYGVGVRRRSHDLFNLDELPVK